ncbi:glycosyltransferase family 9 protein [Bdellovibrio sp. 22V]|uniref:glycosyltransferase family 9 protein n=1 Tax=Bdellovibrio TaxID=958 RepID=UPI002543865E|nr:glycosyltransferase family 9 protein [Bdellovibrio sp. 22V]WII73816.1 glycosyltransferase family 9 protein [Bdellovibrio sp. 22V]
MQTLSVPSAIKKTFPDAEIQWITRKDMAPLLKNHNAIQRVWEFDRKAGLKGLIQLVLKMRSEGFTHIYDAHNNMRSRVIVWMLRPLGFLGIGPKFIRRSIRRWKRFLLFRLRINKFEMPFSGQRDLLEPLLPWGVSKFPPAAPQLFLSEDAYKKAEEILGSYKGAIALAPSAAHFLKRWPKEYWKELILLMPHQKFILLGGPEDSFIEDIRDVAPDRVLNLAGKCSLPVSAGAVGLSSVLVTNDTWLLHAAEQLGHKAIALMGPAPFGFPSRPSTRIMEIDLPCRPCSKHGQGPCVNKNKYHQCLVDITPQHIAAEIKILLGRSS